MFYKVLLISFMELALCREAQIVILVNGMLLPSKQASRSETYDALAEYTFHDGDLVDVTCANPKMMEPMCYLSMEYDYIKRYHNYTNYNRFKYANPVGFQMRMRAANDKTYATCTCYMYNTRSNKLVGINSVRVNFLMRKPAIGKFINVYINNAALRPTTDNKEELEYNYQTNVLNVTCESVQDGDKAQFKMISSSDSIISTVPNKKGVTLFLSLKYNYHAAPSFYCVTEIENIAVNLKPREIYETKDKCSMRLWVEHTNAIYEPLLEIYENGKHDSIYEYKDDDTFTLKCRLSCKAENYTMYMTNLGGGVTKDFVSSDIDWTIVFENISKSKIDKDNVFKWFLERKASGALLNWNVAFVHAPMTTATAIASNTATATNMTSDVDHVDKEDGSNWVVVVICCVTCLVIICAIIVTYIMRNRMNNKSNLQQPGEVIDENKSKDIDGQVPSSPRQWKSIYLIVGQPEDPIYSEPNTGPCGDKEDGPTDPFHDYIDLHKRHCNTKRYNELNYAEIIHSERCDPKNTKVLPKTQTNILKGIDDNSNYVQVLVQSRSAKTWGRVGSSMYANVNDRRCANSEQDESIYEST